MCPICGGPLQAVGGAGDWTCSRCGARLRIDVVSAPVHDAAAMGARIPWQRDEFSLVPAQYTQGTDVPFLDLILVTLGYGPTYGLSAEPAVRRFALSVPGLLESIRALGSAVADAGIRARDGGVLSGSFDDSLKYYSPLELWGFNLALDVIFLLAQLPEITKRRQFTALSALKDIGWTSDHHAWKKAAKHGGEGAPAVLRQLRANVPPRPPLRDLNAHRGGDVTWTD